MPRFIMFAALGMLALVLSSPAHAQGMILDPAVHGLVRLEPLVFGGNNDSASMEPREYHLKVGQGYRWKIKASDLSEYAFVAPEFVRNIWIRKIEVGDPAVEIKAVTFDELEFESGGEIEVFFVAVRPGTYEYGSKGMMERGMVGKILVESAGPAADKVAADDDKDDDDDDDADDDDDGDGDDG